MSPEERRLQAGLSRSEAWPAEVDGGLEEGHLQPGLHEENSGL